MSQSLGIHLEPCIKCDHKPTKREIWAKKGHCSNCGRRKSTSYLWCQYCRKKQRLRMAVRRDVELDRKQALLLFLRMDIMAQKQAKAIEDLQLRRMAQGLMPSLSKNPLLDKPLEPPLEE